MTSPEMDEGGTYLASNRRIRASLTNRIDDKYNKTAITKRIPAKIRLRRMIHKLKNNNIMMKIPGGNKNV
jgi:hypothetical protein